LLAAKIIALAHTLQPQRGAPDCSLFDLSLTPLVNPKSVTKKLDVAKCINGKAFKFAQLLRSDALTFDTYECMCVCVCCVANGTTWRGLVAYSPRKRTGGGNPRLPQEAMNSFICLLAQVATSFCKHFRLHATFFVLPKNPKTATREGYGKRDGGGRARGMGCVRQPTSYISFYTQSTAEGPERDSDDAATSRTYFLILSPPLPFEFLFSCSCSGCLCCCC